ncbi:restriction endonuclease subunit S [Nocardioides alcanivorans]|uniref:restriction endonuclease subunit S n=1 Tax=Nocardioides alcanivorans TaxID=2897352 RepID=UPI001F317D72|nr:restriction endonuclease subunit S [Nocardioides alcanivorans]
MSEWTTLTLAEICAASGGGIQTGPFGSQLHASDYVAEGTPSVMPQNIGDNRISTESIARINDADLARLAKYTLQAGDIVYSRRGDVERRALVREENAGWLCGTGCLRVRIQDQSVHDSRFISFALGLAESREWIVRHAVGATMLNLNTGILGGVPLRVPGVSQQQAIAEVLSALDDKIAANKETTELLLGLADAQFVKAVAGSSPGPLTFGEVADIGGGGTPRTTVDEYWGGAVQWATPTDVTALGAPYLAGTSRTITDEGLAACSSALYPVGSILMTSRATIGAFAVAKIPTAVNQGFIVVNAKNPAHQWWLFHEMKSRVPEFLSFANGATFLELPRGRFKGVNVRLASGDAMAEFGSVVGPLHEAAAAVVAESETLARTRDALLPLLMSGKVRVQDAGKTVEGVL